MASRMDKYIMDDDNYSRSQKYRDNYKDLYDIDYSFNEKLPVSDNINEIDINTLKKITLNRDEYKKLKELENTINIKKQEKENDVIKEEETKIYDINELIERARKEKEKLLEVQKKIINTNYNFLNTLESSNNYQKEIIEKEKNDELGMTREFKYHTKRVNDNPTIEQILEDTANLSLDILSDLKPNGNTIITKPMTEENVSTSSGKNNEFYSGTYTFSKKDFMSDSVKPKKKNIGFKICIVILTMIVIILATIYVLNYFGIDIVEEIKKIVKFV